MSARDRLKSLRANVKIRPAEMPSMGVILDGYVEREGPLLKVYMRSHAVYHHFLLWLDHEFERTPDDGEPFRFTGWDAVAAFYPGADSIEIWGPHGIRVELNDYDDMVRDAFKNPDLIRVVQELGAELVSIKPARRRKRATD